MRANRVRFRNRSEAPPDHEDVFDLSTDVVLLKTELTGVKTDISSLAAAFQVFSDEYRKARQWNWSLTTPLIMVGGVMLTLLGLLIQNQISPLIADVKGLAASVTVLADRVKDDETHARDQDAQIGKSASMDARSEVDRGNLGADVAGLRSLASDNSAGLKELKSVFEKTAGEIETQVAHVEQTRNTADGNLEWKLALLWPQVFHQPYPIVTPPRDTIALRGASR